MIYIDKFLVCDEAFSVRQETNSAELHRKISSIQRESFGSHAVSFYLTTFSCRLPTAARLGAGRLFFTPVDMQSPRKERYP